ncbi:MAG: DEAD/DEAH box helicase family protein, partial [Selenomonadaceae bacterium]|nr:DEAD/DEAH box helicase family protein [Selenomonadaceae bacterium]
MNQKYDTFVKNNGYLNAAKNLELLGDDPNYGRVASIEDYSEDKKSKQVTASKGDIFRKRTANPIVEPTSADTAIDGLNLSLSMRGKVDMQYISDLTGKSESELERELGDQLYKNPMTNLHELAEEYLSGNVREKLAQAREAAKHNPQFKRNVDALQKVQPVDLTEYDITMQIGMTWIKPEYYEDFARHMLNDKLRSVKITLSKALGKWTVEGIGDILEKDFRKWNVTRASGKTVDFFTLLEYALNKQSPYFTYRLTDEKTVPDEQANAEAREKVEEIKEEFNNWIWAGENRKAELLETYNREFNSEVLRHYDGSHLKLDHGGLATDIRDKLYSHQKDAIWRIMQGKNTLLAHCVGAGKTWTMQIAAMEMKRIGLIQKPLFVVPNATVTQFYKDFRKAYGSAKLLVLTSKELAAATGTSNETAEAKQNRIATRKKILSKIVTGDWDGIIISHNLFTRLPISPEAENKFLREQIRALEAEKQAYAMSTGKNTDTTRYQRELERAKAHLEQKLKANIQDIRREIVIPFDELGIDRIFVDEADMFKNLLFQSRFAQRRGKGDTKVVGISTTGSKAAFDLYMKSRILSRMRNCGGMVFATGTPISNTLDEVFTMMRYLCSSELEDKNMHFFDGWAQNYLKGVQTIELSPEGAGFEPLVRLKMTNLQPLIKLYRSFADIKMPEDLPHLKRPNLKNNSRTIVEIETPAAYKDFLLKVQRRAKAIHDGGVDPKDDNFLNITNDLRNAALDMRMIDPSIPESAAGAKLNALCDAVTAKYHETDNIRGTQVIFSDIGVNASKVAKDKSEFDDAESPTAEMPSEENISFYKRIKDALIKRGIPANQIAFVHDAGTDPQKRQKLFDKVNSGEIRVIIGSTGIMGAGVNIQKRLAALHHLTCPWRPRDIEQREGRILRAGNENAEVEIFTYVTKDTFDANMWEKVTLKKEMMDAFLRGDPTIKEIDDFSSEETLAYNDVMSSGITDTSAKEIAELKDKVRVLTYEKNLFAKRQRNNAAEQKKLSAKIPQIQQRIKNIDADISEKTSTAGKNFKMKIGETVYTDRVEAGKAFDELIKNSIIIMTTKVGEIGGFDVKLRVLPSGATFVKLSNHELYPAEPSLRSIEYFISNGIEKALVGAQDKLKYAQTQLAVVEDEFAKPFAKQAELDEATAKLNKLQSKMHSPIAQPETSDAQTETSIDEPADEETSTPQETEESTDAEPESQEIKDTPNGRLEYLGGVTETYYARTKAETAIKDAPRGAIIEVTAESNDGTRTDYYRVNHERLQPLTANGEEDGKTFFKRPKDITANMPLLDAENFKLREVTITEMSKDIDAEKLIASLHKSLKTDTHPALKKWLNKREQELADSNPYSRVRLEDDLLDQALINFTDEELDEREAIQADIYAKQARAKESAEITDSTPEQTDGSENTEDVATQSETAPSETESQMTPDEASTPSQNSNRFDFETGTFTHT